MSTPFTPDYFWDVVSSHLSHRDDFWHIVNGPKREVWFVAESIAALSRASTGHLKTGHRVYGEQSYSSLVKDFGGDIGSLDEDDHRKLPDITVATDYASRLLAVLEAKLCDDFEPANLDGAKGNLQYQLDMARRVFPAVPVIGVIFTVHHLCRAVSDKHSAVEPIRFFNHVSDHAEKVMNFATYEWCHPDRIRPVPCLQKIKPLGGMFNGQASLGIGLLQPRGQKYIS
jgi:hypothetical protein